MDKYIGGAVMVFWNAPHPQPDHVERACRAALSVKAVTGKPIKFVGMGESSDRLEEFRPDGMASRILGRGWPCRRGGTPPGGPTTRPCRRT